MSLILEDSKNFEGENVQTKSFPGGIFIDGIQISDEDFCATILYFMCNTDLSPNDPRLALLGQLRHLTEKPGYQTLLDPTSTAKRLG